jgi:hypothetical protein
VVSRVPIELRVVSAAGFGLVDVNAYVCACEKDITYPIHCSAGGRPGGLIADKGDSRRCFNSSGVYLIAMTAGKI